MEEEVINVGLLQSQTMEIVEGELIDPNFIEL